MAWTEKYANFDLTTGLNDGSSEANAWQTIAAMDAAVVPGNRINIKKQTAPYELRVTTSLVTNGELLAPIYYRGYDQAIGDGGIWEVEYTNADNSIASFAFNGMYNIIEGISYRRHSTLGRHQHAFTGGGTGSWIFRSHIETSVRVLTIQNAAFCYLGMNGQGVSTRLQISSNSRNTCLYKCIVERKNATAAGSASSFVEADLYAKSIGIMDCVFIGHLTDPQDGILLDRSADCKGIYIYNNRFYNCINAIVLDNEPDAISEFSFIFNNVFSTISEYAVKRNAIELGYVSVHNNFYHACTSGFTNYSTEAQAIPNIALSASPYVDPANGDFTINETANGGAILRAAGFPVQMPYDPTSVSPIATYSGPTPAEIATAVWARTGRTLTS